MTTLTIVAPPAATLAPRPRCLRLGRRRRRSAGITSEYAKSSIEHAVKAL